MRSLILLASLAALLTQLLATDAAATTWRVPSSIPTIQAAVDSARTGDVIEIACGTYSESLTRGFPQRNVTAHIENKTLSIRSDHPDQACVTIDGGEQSSGLLIGSGADGTTIEGIRFLKCSSQFTPGGAISSESSIVVRNCIFERNHSSAYGGAIFLGDRSGTQAMSTSFVDDSVFFKNTCESDGSSIVIQGFETRIRRCTFIADRASGGVIWGGSASIAISRCIIARAVLPTSVVVAGTAAFSVHCTTIWASGLGSGWDGPIESQLEINNNTNYDPRFCDPNAHETGDVSLRSDSPCAALVSGCGRIGARDVACDLVAIEPLSLSSLKARY